MQSTTQRPGARWVRRTLRILLGVIGGLLLLVVLLFLLVLTPPFQQWLRAQGTAWLSEKLQTRVALNRIAIGFPRAVTLEGLYVEDRQGDTLLYADLIGVDIRMLRLLSNELALDGIRLQGVTASVDRLLPDTVFNFQFIIDAFVSEGPAEPDTGGTGMRISIGDIRLDQIRALYDDDITGMRLETAWDHFGTSFRSVDLDALDFDIGSLGIRQLRASLSQRVPLLGPDDLATDGAAGSTDGQKPAAAPAWKVRVAELRLEGIHFAYEDSTKPAAASGLDFAHLDVRDLTLHAEKAWLSPDSMHLRITQGALRERAGFQLERLEGDLVYTARETSVRNLLIQTPGTVLRQRAGIRYSSLQAIQDHPGDMELELQLDSSQVQVSDLLLFVPALADQPAFARPSDTYYLDGRISGRLSDIDISSFSIRTPGNSQLIVRGNLQGMPETARLAGKLEIRELRTGAADLRKLLPSGTMPAGIELPARASLQGVIAGNMSDATARMLLQTDLGSAELDGRIRHPMNPRTANYQARVALNNLNLGRILRNDTLYGPLSAWIEAEGSGFAWPHAEARVRLRIDAAGYNQYIYRDIRLSGRLHQQTATLELSSGDPNLSVSGKAMASLGHPPSGALDMEIQRVATLPLGFTTDTLIYSGRIQADFPQLHPDSLEGNLMITGSDLILGSRQIKPDTIALVAGVADTGRFIRFHSPDLQLALTGQYPLTELAGVFRQSIQPYFTLRGEKDSVALPGVKDSAAPYDFRLQGQLVRGPLLGAFVPALTELEPVHLRAAFANGQAPTLDIRAPLTVLGDTRVQGLMVDASGKASALEANLALEQVRSGSALTVYNTRLETRTAENRIDFDLNLEDAGGQDKYHLGGRVEQPGTGKYTIQIEPSVLRLNYQTWTVPEDNLITLEKGDIHIHNLTLERNGQQLAIASTAPAPNAPLELRFGAFRIATLSAFATQDSLLADGVIDGSVLLRDLPTRPVITSDLLIRELAFKGDTVGNLAVKVDNEQTNRFNADLQLTGRGNRMQITGYYSTATPEGAADLRIDIDSLQMRSVQALSMGALREASGHLEGAFTVKGPLNDPAIQGALDFRNTTFIPSMLGSRFRVNDERITIDSRGLRFDQFTVRDANNNTLDIDGMAGTRDFRQFDLDLLITARNFQALNSTKPDNKLFYGKFFFDADLRVQGTMENPSVDGLIAVNDKTDFTVVLPQYDPGVVDREGVVRFVDSATIHTDTTLALGSLDSLGSSSLRGMDISVNIETDPKAILTLVIDEGNGDFLRVQGKAQLTGGIDPSGKTSLTGSYEISDGAYELSINFLKRRFTIQEGSTITWLGDPTRADVNITAVYETETSPLTLVEDHIVVPNTNIYKQRIPFQVQLLLKGDLMKPDISFDIELPENRNLRVDPSVIDNVQARLAQLESQPNELNKQVFALLLLNRFIAENPFASSGGLSAGTVARQSVSRLLAEQLNALAADLIAGVELNFDLQSEEDYTTGQMENRTDLNVSLSKQLLDDRLRVTVGSNFELEGPQQANRQSTNLAGNVALDYVLSRDGRYMIRAYRKNEYEGRLDGYIIETGLNFILTFNYDQLREIFHRAKDRSFRRSRDKEKEMSGESKDP